MFFFRTYPTILAFFVGIVSNAASVIAAQPIVNSTMSSTTSGFYTNKPTHNLRIKDDYYGIRNVSYWVTKGNRAVIDDDVVYPGTVDDLLAHAYTGQEEDDTKDRRALSVFRGPNTWPNATVIYKYDSDETDTRLSSIMNTVISDWQLKAPYLTFLQIPSSFVELNGVLTLTSYDCYGCYAVLGYHATYPSVMNLDQSCTAQGRPNFGCGVPEALHELGHVLGFEHEHQRPDRETTVHFNCQNLDPECGTMPAGATCCDNLVPAGCCPNKEFFDIITFLDSSGPYDITSIMQYRSTAFAKPGTRTLTPAHPGIIVPNQNVQNLSDIDRGRLCKMYNPGGASAC